MDVQGKSLAGRRRLRNRSTLYAVLSLPLAFHLFCIFLAPNANNYIGMIAVPWVEPYVRALSIASTWGFFAPEPGPPPIFIEYELIGDDGESLKLGRFPDRERVSFLRERDNWELATVRYLMNDPAASEPVMVNWLCRRHPEAAQVRVWKLGFTLPGIREVSEGRASLLDESRAERRYAGSGVCDRHAAGTADAASNRRREGAAG